MTENERTESKMKKMMGFLEDNVLYADTLMKIPYAQEINEYYEDSDEWEPKSETPTKFETDLVIYEKKQDSIIPRIIIESKLESITTHDAITYSYKAEKHKNITPFLRYGIMIGNRKHYSLPGRLFRHGTNFDFMFCFAGMYLSETEWKSFEDMLLKEVQYSKDLERMIRDSRNKDRRHYYMLQKQLVLKETGD